ncbi:uncharacterized protein LOC129595251 isoform X1 [Paramacrobiotus metropolitanus]|uniref:uncharacterized protein LOC129595251 isoform X1 n=1 Tax=Paramacrobiotus metropolitanus TaxID=2943436 RepID=UPI0024465453|nr:uncharacterized protein LOC129595251 isoform X1 [Paramacrobiotus metropolitanus]
MEQNSRTFFRKGPEFWSDDAISNKQKEVLAKVMYDVNADDERYLRVHPEVEYIIAAVVMAATEAKPDNPLLFAVDYLASDHLKERVMEQVRKYRLDETAHRRMHQLEYAGNVPFDTEPALILGRPLPSKAIDSSTTTRPHRLVNRLAEYQVV